MATTHPVSGSSELASRIVQALGYDKVERLVLEIDMIKPMRVYVKAPCDYKNVEALAKEMEHHLVQEVWVDENTTDVHYVR